LRILCRFKRISFKASRVNIAELRYYHQACDRDLMLRCHATVVRGVTSLPQCAIEGIDSTFAPFDNLLCNAAMTSFVFDKRRHEIGHNRKKCFVPLHHSGCYLKSAGAVLLRFRRRRRLVDPTAFKILSLLVNHGHMTMHQRLDLEARKRSLDSKKPSQWPHDTSQLQGNDGPGRTT
jgi:hypothetical protein